MLDRSFVFLDVETTGATPSFDRITEIGLVEVECGRYLGEWSSLVNPQRHIPEGIQSLTGITDAMVARAPTFEDLAPDLHRRLDGKVLVAHNARFDYGFLRNEFQRAGIRYAPNVLCTVKLSRQLYPHERRHNLDSLIERHGLECSDRHRALGDAKVLWEFARRIQLDLGAEVVRAKVEELLRPPALPSNLDAGALADIPDAAGVYIFYGENDVPLYIGKSINLRSKVLSHFSGERRTGKNLEIARRIQRIDWTETTGEVGAAIREARLIRQLAPLLNGKLGKTEGACTFHWNALDGPEIPTLVETSAVDFSSTHDLFGLFRSKVVANNALRELADHNELCLILLGLDKGGGPCFGRQLRRCRGACVGQEPRRQHSARLAAALAPLRLRQWPFSGRIAVKETDHASRRSEAHLFDRWSYVGSSDSRLELNSTLEAQHEPGFDADTYRLLQKLFKAPPRNVQIIELPEKP